MGQNAALFPENFALIQITNFFRGNATFGFRLLGIAFAEVARIAFGIAEWVFAMHRIRQAGPATIGDRALAGIFPDTGTG